MTRKNVATVQYQYGNQEEGYLTFRVESDSIHLIKTENPVEALLATIRMAAGVHPKSDPKHPMNELTANSKQSTISAILSHHDRIRREREQIGMETIEDAIRELRRQFGKILESNRRAFEDTVTSLTEVVRKVAEEATRASGGGEVEEDEEDEAPATADTNQTPPSAGM